MSDGELLAVVFVGLGIGALIAAGLLVWLLRSIKKDGLSLGPWDSG